MGSYWIPVFEKHPQIDPKAQLLDFVVASSTSCVVDIYNWVQPSGNGEG